MGSRGAVWEKKRRRDNELGIETGVCSIPTRRIKQCWPLDHVYRWLHGPDTALSTAGTCIGRHDMTTQGKRWRGAYHTPPRATRWWHGAHRTPPSTTRWWCGAVHALQLRPCQWSGVTVPHHGYHVSLGPHCGGAVGHAVTPPTGQ
jgi:hypothetical protein